MSFKPEFHCDHQACDKSAVGTDPNAPSGAPPGWFRAAINPDNGFLDFCSLAHMIDQIALEIERGTIAPILTVYPIDLERLRASR